MPPDLDVDEKQAQRRLLAWYEAHARDLPWRVSPLARAHGILPNPYIVWISEVMLQQTTSAVVTQRLRRFLDRFPDVLALADAPVEAVLQEWAGLGYYARARALHAAARIIARGTMPRTAQGWRLLPGIGAYTANAIAAIAYSEAQAPVDANIARIMARVYGMVGSGNALRGAVQTAATRLLTRDRPGDWAQALMDLGAMVCRPRAPDCAHCPLGAICQARGAGPERFPGKIIKPAKPLRQGVCFTLVHDGAVWLEQRPSKGLLGGMLGLPGGPWAESAVEDPLRHAPVPADWHSAPSIRHTFTHFHLDLAIFAGRSACAPAGPGKWVEIADLPRAGLPSVFAKALTSAASAINLAA